MDEYSGAGAKKDKMFRVLSIVGYAIGDLCGIAAGIKAGRAIRVTTGESLLVVLGGLAAAALAAGLIIFLVWLGIERRNWFAMKTRTAIQAGTALTMAVMILLLFLYRSPGEVAIKYVDASFHANAGAVLALVPDEVIEYVLDETNMSRSEFQETVDSAMESALDVYKRHGGTDVEYRCSIVGNKKLSGDELEELQETYHKMDAEISAAREMEAEITLGEEREESLTIKFRVVKSGGVWYMDMTNIPEFEFE